MIGEGIVELVQSKAPVLALCPIGGFYLELPKDWTAMPSWSYQFISTVSDPGLTTPNSLQMLRLQIDVFGDENGRGADAIKLAAAIDKVLNGFAGRLPDADATFVSCCFSSDTIDFFEDAPRNFRRMIEFEILFAQS